MANDLGALVNGAGMNPAAMHHTGLGSQIGVTDPGLIGKLEVLQRALEANNEHRVEAVIAIQETQKSLTQPAQDKSGPSM